jgi:hypothetical protein
VNGLAGHGDRVTHECVSRFQGCRVPTVAISQGNVLAPAAIENLRDVKLGKP